MSVEPLIPYRPLDRQAGRVVPGTQPGNGFDAQLRQRERRLSVLRPPVAPAVPVDRGVSAQSPVKTPELRLSSIITDGPVKNQGASVHHAGEAALVCGVGVEARPVPEPGATRAIGRTVVSAAPMAGGHCMVENVARMPGVRAQNPVHAEPAPSQSVDFSRQKNPSGCVCSAPGEFAQGYLAGWRAGRGEVGERSTRADQTGDPLDSPLVRAHRGITDALASLTGLRDDKKSAGPAFGFAWGSFSSVGSALERMTSSLAAGPDRLPLSASATENVKTRVYLWNAPAEFPSRKGARPVQPSAPPNIPGAWEIRMREMVEEMLRRE